MCCWYLIVFIDRKCYIDFIKSIRSYEFFLVYFNNDNNIRIYLFRFFKFCKELSNYLFIFYYNFGC